MTSASQTWLFNWVCSLIKRAFHINRRHLGPLLTILEYMCAFYLT
ncbi:hypothetical protein DET57_12181 [Klebsiella oxytoca]|uniref:Uncharacterized protein n=1 Tax=Klebsiella oxytoca TaxID=571 RepID=A0A318FFM9_KLEOX|nr:hypothetical protein DET57_12181 [Klebsiella oxytoca]